MSKHTPGKWEYGVREDSSKWLSIGDPAIGPHYQGDLCASLADAKLIAAAPELLEALAGLVARYKALVNSGDCGLWNADDEHEIKAAMDAIAKAEGR